MGRRSSITLSIARAGSLVLALVGASACAALAPSPVTVVTIAPATGATDVAIVERASKSRSPGLAHELDDAPAELAGGWRACTNTRFTIEVSGGHASVVDAVDDNIGQHYTILRSRFAGGVLTWSFRIPSTSAVMTYETTALDGDALRARWQSDTGSVGDDTLQRWPPSNDDDSSP